jgi:hypothetical protein
MGGLEHVDLCKTIKRWDTQPTLRFAIPTFTEDPDELPFERSTIISVEVKRPDKIPGVPKAKQTPPFRENLLPKIDVQFEYARRGQSVGKSESDDTTGRSSSDQIKIIPSTSPAQIAPFELAKNGRRQDSPNAPAINGKDSEPPPRGPW